MTGTQANVIFNNVDMEACLKQGLMITGSAHCPHCQQDHPFQLYLQRRESMSLSLTADKEAEYEVCINFYDPAVLAANAASRKDSDAPCVPCRGCVMNCPKLSIKKK